MSNRPFQLAPNRDPLAVHGIVVPVFALLLMWWAGCVSKESCRPNTLYLEIDCSSVEIPETQLSHFLLSVWRNEVLKSSDVRVQATCPRVPIELDFAEYRKGESVEVRITPISIQGNAGKAVVLRRLLDAGCARAGQSDFVPSNPDGSPGNPRLDSSAVDTGDARGPVEDDASQPTCSAGESTCSGDRTRQACVDGEWGAETTCNGVCRSGTCKGTCEPGTTTCSATGELVLCGSEGEATQPQVCPGGRGCVTETTNRAVCPSCPTSPQECGGSVGVRCDGSSSTDCSLANGCLSLNKVVPCTHGCNIANGQCFPECSPGMPPRCSVVNGTREVCNASGRWELQQCSIMQEGTVVSCVSGNCISACDGVRGFVKCDNGSCRKECPTFSIIPTAGNAFPLEHVVISGDGQVLFGYGNGPTLRWSKTGALEKLPNFDEQADIPRGASADGAVLASFFGLWIRGTGLVDCRCGPDCFSCQGIPTYLNHISSDALRVLGKTNEVPRVWNREEDSFRELPGSELTRLSGDGRYAVGTQSNGSAIRWDWAANKVEVLWPGGAATLANNDASVVYGFGGVAGAELIRWSAASIEKLPGNWSNLAGCSASGDVLVGDLERVPSLLVRGRAAISIKAALEGANVTLPPGKVAWLGGVSYDGKVVAGLFEDTAGVSSIFRAVLP